MNNFFSMRESCIGHRSGSIGIGTFLGSNIMLHRYGDLKPFTDMKVIEEKLKEAGSTVGLCSTDKHKEEYDIDKYKLSDVGY